MSDRVDDVTPEEPKPAVARDRVVALLDAVRHLSGLNDADEILTAITDSICAVGGFGAAVVNLVEGEELRAMAASSGAEPLIGTSSPRLRWERLLAGAEARGALRVVRHDADPALWADMPSLTLGTQDDLEPDRWHFDDCLFAPLFATDGRLLGILSIDEPIDGRFSDDEQFAVLELFAAQVAQVLVDLEHPLPSDDAADLYRPAFLRSAAPMVLLGPDLRVHEANRAAVSLLGPLPRGDVFADRISSGDRTRFRKALRAVVDDPLTPTTRLDLMLTTSHGETNGHGTVRVEIAPVPSSNGVVRAALHLTDLVAAHRDLADLHHQANHDELTGLLNRRALQARLAVRLERLSTQPASEVETSIVLLAADLDGFKAINDRHGHAVGDQVLIAIAQLLRHAVREGDDVVRVGGDEFVILATVPVGSEATAELAAQRCVRSIAEGIELDGVRHSVTISVGIALATAADPPAAIDLLARADRALYRAKRAGRNRWEFAGDEDL